MSGPVPLWLSRLRDLFLRRRFARDLDDELAFHLAQRTEDNIKAGMSAEEAHIAALRSFGNLTATKERMFNLGRLGFLEDFWNDLGFGARKLRRSPGFTAAAVLALAIGVGLNTTVFTVVNALLVRPLPGIPDAEGLVRVGRNNRPGTGEFNPVSYPNYLDLRARVSTMEGLAAYRRLPLSISLGSATERVDGQLVSENFFDVLGVKAAVGRTFLPEENRTLGGDPVVVIGYSLWQRLFHGDHRAAGKTVAINGRDFTVAGVAPRGFLGVIAGQPTEVWMPLLMYQDAMPYIARYGDLHKQRDSNWLVLFGRLKGGSSWQSAGAELRTLYEQLKHEYPKDIGQREELAAAPHLGLYPAERKESSEFLALLVAAAGLVLAVACVNVANLLLARAASRRREISVRLAIGASRGRIVRQLLAEGLLLAVLGGVAGLALAWKAAGWIELFPPSPLFPYAFNLAPDLRVLGFTLALSLLASVAAALAPAIETSRPDLSSALKEGGPQQGRRRGWMRSVLVAGQVAVCLVVLAGAGLLVRTLRNLHSLDLGLETRDVLLLSFDLGLNRYSDARGQDFYQRLLDRLHANPNVASAALAAIAPLQGLTSDTFIAIEGKAPPGRRRGWGTAWNTVTPGFFETLRIPIVAGRDFTERDTAAGPRVAIVNQSAAREFWPGESPIGKRFRWLGPNAQWIEVVGIARDANLVGPLRQQREFVFVPLAQEYVAEMTLHARARRDLPALAELVRREVRELDPRIPLFGVRTLAGQAEATIWRQRMAARLVGGFGLLALALSVLGIYGVTAYSASERTQEIGLRVALGARGGHIVGMLLGQGARMVLAGVAVGLAGALAATRVLASRLYGVDPADPATLGGVSLLLIGVALLACYLPARRALRLDPVAALRSE